MDKLGREGPHPDTVVPLIRWFAQRRGRTLKPGQLRFLQQRTLTNLNLFSGRADETAALAVISHPPHDELLLYFARRTPGGSTWEIGGHTTTPIGNPPMLPYVARTMTAGGRLIFAILATHPQVGAARVTLGDGAVLEDRITNGSALIFAAMESAQQWSREALVQVLDVNGAELKSTTWWVDPTRKPPDLVAPG